MITQEPGNPLFPVFLKLDKIVTLIVGGGNVGLEKLEALLKNDAHAQVRLVGTDIKPEIEVLAKTHRITLRKGAYKKEDLEGVSLLILATDDRQLHEEIYEQAHTRHLLTNVADTPDLCDFYLGSTVKKGDLKIGISTNGKSPTLAKRMRELLESSLPDEIDDLLQNLKDFRDQLEGDFSEKVRKLNEVTRSIGRDK